MQCPYCSYELNANSVACEKCGAHIVVRRTTAGIFAGWIGILMVLVLATMLIPLLLMPFIGFSLEGYPWLFLVIGTVVTTGFLWYSKSTIHSQWVRPED